MKALTNLLCWLGAIVIHFLQVLYTLMVPFKRHKGLMTEPKNEKTIGVAYAAKAWMYRMFSFWHVDSYSLS